MCFILCLSRRHRPTPSRTQRNFLDHRRQQSSGTMREFVTRRTNQSKIDRIDRLLEWSLRAKPMWISCRACRQLSLTKMGRIGEIVLCLIIIFLNIFSLFFFFWKKYIFLGSFLVFLKNSCFSHSLHLVIEKAQSSAGNYCPSLLIFKKHKKHIFIYFFRRSW